MWTAAGAVEGFQAIAAEGLHGGRIKGRGMEEQDFVGAKVALFVGDRLLITLRDDFEGLPYPGLWDFPGGGREGDETPEQTLLREVKEEVGLTVPEAALMWKRQYPAQYLDGKAKVWFFVAQVPTEMASQVVFGDEGQGWAFVSLQGFLGLDQVVPSYAARVQDWLDATGAFGGKIPNL